MTPVVPVAEAAAVESPGPVLTRLYLLRLSWPIILANAAVPLLGLADTAVIGNVGTLAELGAIAFGAVIFSFVYWSFGFLRMGTTGFTAQAAGARDEAEVRATLWRALGVAFALGGALIALQLPIGRLALFLLDGSDEVEALTRGYFHVRIWGAPAALGMFVLMGTLIGLGRGKLLLVVQLFLNGLNILLDVWFAGVLGWGAEGVALGTALAEWTALVLAAGLVFRLLRARHRDAEPFLPLARLKALGPLRRALRANFDIMLRTLLLVASFAWFVRQSGQFGDDVLAAHHILLQFIAFSAFFLDGYAYVVEALIGESVGAGDRRRFDVAVRLSTELAAVTAAVLALMILVFGNVAAGLLTVHEPVLAAADRALPMAAIYVALAFAAFQLDGIFIGATRTREMRNASFVSVAVFLAASAVLIPWAGSQGLWLAFIAYVCARALALGCYYPALRRSIA